MNSIVVQNTINELLVPFVYEDDDIANDRVTKLMVDLVSSYLKTMYELGYIRTYAVHRVPSFLSEARGIILRVDCEFVHDGDFKLWSRDFQVRTNFYYDENNERYIGTYWDGIRTIIEPKYRKTA